MSEEDMTGEMPRSMPTVLLERMESATEEAPDHLMSLLKEQVNIVWMDEFMSNPHDFADAKIIAIMCFHGAPKVTPELIDMLPKLKLVANFGAGYNNLDTKMLQAKKIKASNTPEVLNNACANHAILLILAAAREFTRDIKRATDPSTTGFLKNHVCEGVDQKTLGIVGMGSIGLAVAKRARALNMNIRYHNRKKNPDDQQVCGKFHPFLNEMLPHCDYVIVTVALTPQTTNIIGKNQFAEMKKSAAFINVSRGATCDHVALIKALENGEIRWASLDVTDPEPLRRDSPLLKMDNVIVTCHTSSATEECRKLMCQKAIDNVLAVFEGKPLVSEIPSYKQ